VSRSSSNKLLRSLCHWALLLADSVPDKRPYQCPAPISPFKKVTAVQTSHSQAPLTVIHSNHGETIARPHSKKTSNYASPACWSTASTDKENVRILRT
jgi:hypothetical protein